MRGTTPYFGLYLHEVGYAKAKILITACETKGNVHSTLQMVVYIHSVSCKASQIQENRVLGV